MSLPARALSCTAAGSAPSTAADGAAVAPWEPRIVAFFCSWCAYTAADMTGVGRGAYAANVRIVRVSCSGRVDPQFVLHAFERGADGVLIGGCHPGDCHFVDGNQKALRRFVLLRRTLQQAGVDPARFRLEWIAASETTRLRQVVDEMVEQIRRLGPLALPVRAAELDRELAQAAQDGAPTEAASV